MKLKSVNFYTIDFNEVKKLLANKARGTNVTQSVFSTVGQVISPTLEKV